MMLMTALVVAVALVALALVVVALVVVVVVAIVLVEDNVVATEFVIPVALHWVGNEHSKYLNLEEGLPTKTEEEQSSLWPSHHNPYRRRCGDWIAIAGNVYDQDIVLVVADTDAEDEVTMAIVAIVVVVRSILSSVMPRETPRRRHRE